MIRKEWMPLEQSLRFQTRQSRSPRYQVRLFVAPAEEEIKTEKKVQEHYAVIRLMGKECDSPSILKE